MEFTGRITADAKVSTVKGDKEVVNFSVAINDRYRPKGATETKEFVTYINVAWWLGTGISKILRKGAIVTISGRVYPNAYIDLQGNAKASINCHASEIKLVHSKKLEVATTEAAAVATEQADDLPF
ncbi:MAG: single-stranded DNA-binding protein [Sediminibacterium sp.]|nr:single-stranded DNA-binding protein [Sediminibacterium sp.]